MEKASASVVPAWEKPKKSKAQSFDLHPEILMSERHNFDLVYQLCETIIGGSRPVVFSRSNHDTRGIYAEKIADYTPNHFGNSYYTFRLGKLLGIVIDTGEDKPDNHAEYGNAMAYHEFRLEEDEFIEIVIKSEEYY